MRGMSSGGMINEILPISFSSCRRTLYLNAYLIGCVNEVFMEGSNGGLGSAE